VSDWFRTPDWSPEAQEDFEARLRRARPHNRTQYTRIKGLALGESGQVEAARSLWLRILADESGHDFERATTLEHLGDSYREEDPAAAQSYYRRLLSDFPILNGTTHAVEVSLAELLSKKRSPAARPGALDLLNSFLERRAARSPNVLFKWHLVLIDLAAAEGERDRTARGQDGPRTVRAGTGVSPAQGGWRRPRR